MLLDDGIDEPTQSVGIHLFRGSIDVDALGGACSISGISNVRCQFKGGQRSAVPRPAFADRAPDRLLVVGAANSSSSTRSDCLQRNYLSRRDRPLHTTCSRRSVRRRVRIPRQCAPIKKAARSRTVRLDRERAEEIVTRERWIALTNVSGPHSCSLLIANQRMSCRRNHCDQNVRARGPCRTF
jgi:hypothetical protein